MADINSLGGSPYGFPKIDGLKGTETKADRGRCEGAKADAGEKQW